MADLDPDFAALNAAPPAQTGQAQTQLDPDFAALKGPTPSTPRYDTSNGSYWGTPTDWLKAMGSAVVRPAIKAAAGVPTMFANATTALGNIATGHVPLYQPNGSLNWKGTPDRPVVMPGQALDNVLDQYTQAPQGIGKGAEFFNTALLSAGASELPQLGALTGNALPKLGAQAPAGFVTEKAAKAAASSVTNAQKQAFAGGVPLGMRPLPGIASGSVPLQQIEARLESIPWTSGPLAALKNADKAALDRAAAKSIGEDAPNVDSTVLNTAHERMGNTFDSVGDPNTILYTTPGATRNAVSAIAENTDDLLPNSIPSLMEHPLVTKLLQATDSGAVTGQQLRQLSSKLNKVAYKQMTTPNGDRDLGEGLYEVKNHVDDLIASNLSGEALAEYNAVRGQYRNFQNLMRPGVVDSATGHVNPARLASVLAKRDQSGYTLGNNTSDLYSAVRYMQSAKSNIANSGTGTRSFPILSSAIPVLGSMLGAGASHAAGGSGAEGMMGAAAGAVGLPLAGNALTRFYLSPFGQNLIRKSIAAPSLMAPAVRPALQGGLLAISSN